MDRTVEANGVTLGVERFGDAAAALPSCSRAARAMLSWPDALCAALARGGRRVVRYDLRDTGRSTTVDPDSARLTRCATWSADAVGVLGTGSTSPARTSQASATGGFIAQLLALDHPSRVASLVLIGTRPVAPGPVDDDLPGHSPADRWPTSAGRRTGDRLDRPHVDPGRRGGRSPAGAPAPRSSTPPRPATTPPAFSIAAIRRPASAPQQGLLSMMFSKLDCTPRWRERLPADHRADIGAARRSRPVLPARQRNGAGHQDPRRAAARPRTGRRPRSPIAAADEVAAAMLAL